MVAKAELTYVPLPPTEVGGYKSTGDILPILKSSKLKGSSSTHQMKMSQKVNCNPPLQRGVGHKIASGFSHHGKFRGFSPMR